MTKGNNETNSFYYSEPAKLDMHIVGGCVAFSTLHSKPAFLSPVNLHQCLLVEVWVGHFSLTTFSTYTALSTLFDWLWMWVASATWQCVCDINAVIS
ncbi:MAG: hypothetical protein HOP37_02920 [Cyclobacteriaceae bacterium]|nr:hypothetical protein [Cyclobacteriaceae bacterium]